MNRNVLIGIVVVIIVALGIWYFASLNTGAATPDTATTSVSTGSTGTTGTTGTTGAATPANPSTFHSIFTQSGNHECSYQQVQASGQSSSVVYIADGKMRGEFRTTGSTPSANLMIYTGGVLYAWKEGATTGKKTSITSLADLPQAIPQDLTSGAIFGVSADNVSWDCHDWAKDVKLFTLPTYVTFS